MTLVSCRTDPPEPGFFTAEIAKHAEADRIGRTFLETRK